MTVESGSTDRGEQVVDDECARVYRDALRVPRLGVFFLSVSVERSERLHDRLERPQRGGCLHVWHGGLPPAVSEAAAGAPFFSAVSAKS